MVDAALEAPKRKSQERSRTREAILVAAITLYKRDGYGAVTMRAIAQQLGFSAPAIYNYFLSKEEIFLALQERGIQMLADAVLTPPTDDPLDDLRQIFVRYYQFTKAHPEYFTLLYVDPSTPRLNFFETDALGALVKETITRVERCVERRILPPDAVNVAAGYLWSIVHGAAVLRQIQNAAPGQNFDTLALSGVELTLSAIRSGLLPQAIQHAVKKA